MIEGATIKLAGTEYVVPPLNLSSIKRLKADLLKVNSGEANEDAMDSIARIVHAALVRNYPDMTIEQVEEKLDLQNFPQVLAAVMGNSGFVKKAIAAATGIQEAGQ